MTIGVYPKSNCGATISGAGSPIPAGPPHVVRYALNSGPGLNIPAWAVYIALAHFSDDHGLSERTHREIADAIDAGSVSTVKVAIQHLEYFGKVEVTRRPGSTGGRNLPNVYRITGEEFDWQPTPKEPREPGQIFAAYRRRHAEIEAEHRRSYEALEQSHRQREQDLLRRIGELEAAANGHAPRQGEDAALPWANPPSAGRRPSRPNLRLSHHPTLPAHPSPSGRSLPGPATTIPPASLPKCRKRIPRSWTAGRRLSLRTRTPPPDPSEEAEDEVDLLTREFWPWIKGKWDDINNAIHWYKRNRGEWTRQLKNARAARETEERRQANPGDRADRHRQEYEPGYEPGGEETERVPLWDSSIQADPDARSLWAAVLADLQLQLPRPTFETWLKPTAGVAFQEDRFIVVTPTPFAAEWLERRIFHTLQSALERAAGRGLQLQLQALAAHSGDDPPVVDYDQGNPSGPDHETPHHETGGETGE